MDFRTNTALNDSLLKQVGSAMGGLPFGSGGPSIQEPTPPAPAAASPVPAPTPTPAAAAPTPTPTQPVPMAPDEAPIIPPPSQRQYEALAMPQISDKQETPKFASKEEAFKYLDTNSTSLGDFIRKGYEYGFWDEFGNGKGMFDGGQFKTPAMVTVLSTFPSDKNKIKKFQQENLDYARATSYAEALFPGDFHKQLAYIKQASGSTYSMLTKTNQAWAKIDIQNANSGIYQQRVDELLRSNAAKEELAGDKLALDADYKAKKLDLDERKLANTEQYRNDQIDLGYKKLEQGQQKIDQAGRKLDLAESKQSTKDYGNLAKEEASDNSFRESINDVYNKLDLADGLLANASFYDTGAIGQFFGSLPFASSTDAATIRKLIDGIKNSNMALLQLRDMKANSPNGASGLGAASDRDMKVLAESVANLDYAGNEKVLKHNLGLIRSRLDRLRSTLDQRAEQRAQTRARFDQIYGPQDQQAAQQMPPQGLQQQPMQQPADNSMPESLRGMSKEELYQRYLQMKAQRGMR